MKILKQKTILKCYFELEESFLNLRGKRSSKTLIDTLETKLGQNKEQIKDQMLKSRAKFL